MAQPDQKWECALCGYRAEPVAGTFRLLGAEPVTIVVCADLSACVRRFDARRQPTGARASR